MRQRPRMPVTTPPCSEFTLLSEVLTSAEGAARAGYDGDAEGGLGVEPGEEGGGFPVGGVGEGVEGFGAIEG